MLIDRLAVFCHCITGNGFQFVSRFLEDSHRAWIPFEYAGRYPAKVPCVECVIGHCPQRFSHNSSAPELFTQPVANLGRSAKDVVFEYHANAADCCSLDFNRETRQRICRAGDSDPPLGVFMCVGVWKSVSQIPPDLSVIGVVDERLLVTSPPRANGALGQFDLHNTRYGLRSLYVSCAERYDNDFQRKVAAPQSIEDSSIRKVFASSGPGS